MNDSDLRQLADAMAQVLRPHLERSEPLRRAVGLIGKWLCEEARGIGAGVQDSNTPIAPDQISIAAPEVIASPAIADPPAPIEAREGSAAALAPDHIGQPISSAIVPLKLGDAVVQLPLSGTAEELGRAFKAAIKAEERVDEAVADDSGRTDTDLALVEWRCRLKAASCRLFIRKRAAAAGSEVEHEIRNLMNEMIAQAKALPECFLWVFWREAVQPDDAVLARIAENYEAHADAVGLMLRIDEAAGGERSEDEVEALHLLAEANSALRVGLDETWLTKDDHDQAEIHWWLRQEPASRRVFIERHMTVDDPADSSNAGDLLARIRQIGKGLDERARRAKAIKSGLSQIRYHAGQIVKNGAGESQGDWARIGDAVTMLGSAGVVASDRRIAEAVGPEAAALWSAEGPVVRGLSTVVERARALTDDREPDAEDEPSSRDRVWSKSVLEVRELLRGRQIVVIGGKRNAAAVERFVKAFEVIDAEWVSLTEHGSGGAMRAPIHRSDTALVVVIVKLAGHLHGDEARGYAEAAGKPCIVLTGGYNPERVARAVLDQASGRLDGSVNVG